MMNYPLLYLFIAAALARFVTITQSLWLDEATTVNVARNMSAQQIITQFSPNDFHPPLYYLVMDMWVSLFGSSEIAVRIPSVLFCLLAGYFVYKIGTLIGNAKIGFASAAFFLFNPLVLYYSQEVRMYMMVTALCAIACYYFLKLIKKPKAFAAKDVVVFNLAIGLSFGTFYGSVFLIAAMYLYLLIKKQFRLLLLSIPGSILSFAILYPLLARQFNQAQGALIMVKNWDLVLGIPTLKNVLLLPLKFVTGRISFEPKLVYFGLGLISTLIVWFFAIRGGYRQKALLFLSSVTLLIAFIFSFSTPLFQYFRFLYLLPLFSVLIGYGTRGFKWERYTVMGIFIFFSIAYLAVPAFHREDWKHVLISVPQSQPVYMIPSATDPIQYYYPERKVLDLFSVEKNPPTAKHVFIVPYTAEIYGFNYRSHMEKQKYTLRSQEDYRGVILEEWTK